MARHARKPTALDLFCGSGGVTHGLKKAGFDVLGAIDVDPKACETYRSNHRKVRLIERDINAVNPDEFTDLIEDHLDLIAICAPCQPFSSQNRKRAAKDERAELVLSALPFIEKFQPRLVFLENVPGLEHEEVFDRFTSGLKALGYKTSKPMRVDAADLGVPQRRTRMIMIAAKGVSLEAAVQLGKQNRKTVRDTIGDLPVPSIGRINVGGDILHFARRHTELNIERLKHIPGDGGGREALPIRLQLECHKNGCKASSYSDTYGRMRWGDVAPTLTTGCTDITRGRFAHPEQHRAITLREAARLQSFPDDYKFAGNTSEISAQIGNAVPPEMMRTIGKQLQVALLKTTEMDHCPKK